MFRRLFGEGQGLSLIPELRTRLEHRQVITRRCERARARIVAHVFHGYGQADVRTFERYGVSRSVAMKLTGHKTEAIYRRSAIVAENDLRETGTKLMILRTKSQKGLLNVLARFSDSAEEVISMKKWWAGTGLNRRHQDFQFSPVDRPHHLQRPSLTAP